MDMQKTAREIGLFETAVNLVSVCDSIDVREKIGDSLPLPDTYISQNIKNIAKWLVSFKKNKYLFVMPEIALAEAMAELVDSNIEIIFLVSCDMDSEAKERLENNLPKQMKVSILEEPFFPSDFFPGNGMLVISGYMAGTRSVVFLEKEHLFHIVKLNRRIDMRVG